MGEQFFIPQQNQNVMVADVGNAVVASIYMDPDYDGVIVYARRANWHDVCMFASVADYNAYCSRLAEGTEIREIYRSPNWRRPGVLGRAKEWLQANV